MGNSAAGYKLKLNLVQGELGETREGMRGALAHMCFFTSFPPLPPHMQTQAHSAKDYGKRSQACKNPDTRDVMDTTLSGCQFKCHLRIWSVKRRNNFT